MAAASTDGAVPGSARTLVLGLGNDMMSDDGVGLLAARRVAELAGDRVDHVEACVATIDLLEVISGYDRVVVVDAVLADLPPGTPVTATPDDLPGGFGYRSFHTLPFSDMLEIGRRLEMEVPSQITIHGLAVGDPMTFGDTLTPEVAAAWPAWAEEIARIEFG